MAPSFTATIENTERRRFAIGGRREVKERYVQVNMRTIISQGGFFNVFLTWREFYVNEARGPMLSSY